jgi:addiction module HigA family antidote
MPMKNPPHPGRLVKENIEDLGLSVADAAQGLGITRQQLYNVISGKSAITPEMAVRLEKAIGSTGDAWLRMQAAHDLAQIRMRRDKIKVRRLEPRHA